MDALALLAREVATRAPSTAPAPPRQRGRPRQRDQCALSIMSSSYLFRPFFFEEPSLILCYGFKIGLTGPLLRTSR